MEFPLVPFIGFAIAAYITPGPNNVMISAASAGHGIRATLPLVLGIAVGFSAMVVITGLGLAGPLALYPRAQTVMRWVGVAWLLFLAWQIATAGAPGAGKARPPLGFLGGAMFQWVNPKAWLLMLGVATTWISPAGPLVPQVGIMAVLFFVFGLPCLLFWAALGAGAARLLSHPGWLRAFNVAMAILLVASMVPVVLEE
jgi:threonine/homoserine/homoserine lactone efflux protein